MPEERDQLMDQCETQDQLIQQLEEQLAQVSKAYEVSQETCDRLSQEQTQLQANLLHSQELVCNMARILGRWMRRDESLARGTANLDGEGRKALRELTRAYLLLEDRE